MCVPPPTPQCLQFGEGSVTGDMCEDLCVVGLVEYKRCLYYENGKKVIEARWRGSPVILKSKLENFTSYEPLGILDYQVRAGGSQEGTGGGGPLTHVVLSNRTQRRSSRRSMWFSTPLWR